MRWQAILSLWLSISFALPLEALADDTVKTQVPGNKHPKSCQKADPLKCAQELVSGETVSESGIWMSYKQAAALEAKVETADDRLKAALEAQAKLDANDLAHEKQLHQIDNEANEKKLKDADDALKKMEVPFYERPLFVAGATTIVVLGLVYSSVKVYDALRR